MYIIIEVLDKSFFSSLKEFSAETHTWRHI